MSLKRRNWFSYELLFSRVFDPPWVLMALAWIHALDLNTIVTPDWFWLVSGSFIALLIVSTLRILVRMKRLYSGWDLRDRKERAPVLIVLTLGLILLMTVAVALEFPAATMVYGTLAFLFAAITFVTVVLRFKISIHAASISALFVSLSLTQFSLALVLLPAVLLVAHARVKGGYHTVSEVVTGALLPMVLLTLVWRFFWCLTLKCPM